MNEYIVQKNIDYIAISCDIWNDTYRMDKVEETRPKNYNYNQAVVYDNGIIRMWHDSKPEMRTHVIMSGQTLNNLRSEGLTDEQIITWCRSAKLPKFTRIDLAITSHAKDGTDHELKPHTIAELARDGRCNTRMKTAKHITSPDIQIETAYIGSRKSGRLFRAYDKGIELGETANKLIRYELETRAKADKVADMVMRGDDLGSIINAYIEFDHDIWHQIVGEKSVVIPRTKTSLSESEKRIIENSKRWEWLITTVAPTLAKALAEDKIEPNDNLNLAMFSAVVSDEYNDIIDKVSKKG